MKRFILYVLAAFAFAACTQNEIEELSSNKLFVPDNISVGFENDDTRIQLLNGKTVWNEGDCVSVFYRSFNNLLWQFQGQTGDRTGELKLIEGYIGNQTMEDVIIVYPYNENYLVRLADKSIEAHMPATQYYRYNSYDPQSNLMIAHSTGRDFVLKNVCGWIRVELTGNGEVVRSLTLRGNNDELVAGDIAIDAAEATATFMASNGTAPGDDSEVGGDLVFEDESFTSVKLQCSGVELSSEPTAFYIALPPQTFTNGFTVEVKCQGYQPMVLQRNDAIAIERNHIQPMQVVEFEAEESDEVDIPNNEIWYTATYQVWPNNEGDFGATLIDNYFDYNTGEGILTFDGDVTRIPVCAFWDNWNLTSITLPNSIAEIESFAFDNCWGLTTMTIPDNTTVIELGAFSSCGNLEKFEGWCASEDGRCLVIDDVLVAFAPADLSTYTTPSGVVTIGAYVFRHCSSLNEIFISDGVEIIGSEAFYGSRLHTVVMPNSVLYIRDGAFQDCSELRNIELPANLQEISYQAFRNCDSLNEITIPDSVNTFGHGMFADCDKLERINSQYSSEDGRSLIFHGDLIAVAWGGISSYTLPDEVEVIEGYCFAYSTLTEINLNDNLTSIRYSAFDNSQISTITLPASLSYIGYEAFIGCYNLTSFYCQAIEPPYIDGSLFGWEAPKCTIYVPLESLDRYLSAEGWSGYASMIAGIDYETGEVVEPTINIGICGTITDWGGSEDIAMEYLEERNLYVAYGIELTTDDSFKLRTDNRWDGVYNIGYDYETTIAPNFAIKLWNSSNSQNLYVGENGTYDIYIDLDTMMLYFMEAGESPENATVQRDRIGIAGSFTEWGDYPDIAMSYDEDMAMYVYYGLELNEGDQFKLRVNELWDINYGLDNYIAAFPINSFTSLVNNGYNIIVHETGSYDLYFEPNYCEFFFMEAGVDRSEAMDAATITQLPAPQNVRVINESATSFTLTWDHVENASSYKIKDDTGIVYTTSENYIELTDLTPYTLYYARVSAQPDSPSYMSSAWVGTYAYTIDVNQSCSWFTQTLSPGQGAEYDHQPYNSLDITWKGTGVTSISYLLLDAEDYYYYGYSLGLIVANMNNNTGDLLEPINSDEGFSSYYSGRYQDCGYILFTLVTNEQGETYMAISESKTESYELSEAESRWIGTWQMTAHKALVYDGGNVSIVDREESFTVNITANPNIARSFFVDGFSVLGEGWPIQAKLNENNELCLISGYLTDNAYNGYYAWLSYCIYSDGNEGYNTYNAPVQIFSMDEAGNVSCRLHSDIAYYSDDSTVTYTNIHTEMYVYTYNGFVEYITDSYPVTYRAGEMDMVKLADNRAAKSSAMSANGLQGYKLTPNKKIKRDNLSTLKSDISVVYTM